MNIGQCAYCEAKCLVSSCLFRHRVQSADSTHWVPQQEKCQLKYCSTCLPQKSGDCCGAHPTEPRSRPKPFVDNSPEAQATRQKMHQQLEDLFAGSDERRRKRRERIQRVAPY